MRKFHCDITLIGTFLIAGLLPNSYGIYAYTQEHEHDFRDKLEYVLGDSDIHDEKEIATNDEIHGRFSHILSDVLMTEKAPLNSVLDISKSTPELNGYLNDTFWGAANGICCYAEPGDEPGSMKYNDSFPGVDCNYGPYGAGSMIAGDCPPWAYSCPGDGSNFCGPSNQPRYIDNATIMRGERKILDHCRASRGKPFRGSCCYAEKCDNTSYKPGDFWGQFCYNDRGGFNRGSGYCPSWAYECPGNGSNFCGFDWQTTSAAKSNHHQSIPTSLVLFLAFMALNIGIKS